MLRRTNTNLSIRNTHSTAFTLQKLHGSEVPTLCRKFRPTHRNSLLVPLKCSRPAIVDCVGCSDVESEVSTPLGISVLVRVRGSRAISYLTNRKFRPSLGSSDKCIKHPVTASFWGSGIYTPSAPHSFAAASPDLNTLLSLHNFSPSPPRANP